MNICRFKPVHASCIELESTVTPWAAAAVHRLADAVDAFLHLPTLRVVTLAGACCDGIAIQML